MDNKFKFSQIKKTETKIEVSEYNSVFKDAWRRFKKNKTAIIGGIIFILLVFFAILFTNLPNYDALSVSAENADLGASKDHWWGTDSVGRDFWSRNWGAIRYSLLLAFITTTINIMIAILIGLSMGYFEKFDRYFSYVIKVLYALPSIIILILFAVIFDTDDSFLAFWVIVLSLTFSGWVNASQQIRGITLKTRNLDFITASQTLGTKRFKILKIFFVYALPTIIIQYAIIFPRMIISESILGFLGLSVPDIPTLGNLINDGRAPFLNHPYQLLIPLTMLAITTISIQLVVFGIEDALTKKEAM